jgi:hypothetical protein
MAGTAILLPDAVAIRNIILGRVADRLQEPLLMLHALPENEVGAVKAQVKAEACWSRLAGYQERALTFALRQSLAYAQMFWADTGSMRFNRQRRVRGSWKTRLTAGTAKLVGQIAASPSSIRLLELAHCRAVARFPEVQQYRAILARQRPSVLFCANQRSNAALPVVLAAKSLGIPTATFIVSWDNLTSKGRIAAPFDHYLVWSDHMRRELIRYYPDIPYNAVHIVGTPQFDCYSWPEVKVSREEFFRSIGADPVRKLICYSGGDVDTSPEDQDHVRILMELVRSGEIGGNPQVVVRPCPVDDGRRYDAVRKQFPELLYCPPKWAHPEPGNWARCMPSFEDMKMLANFTAHADINVNLASTMTLDFSIHDRPVVNVAFNVGVCPPSKVPLWDHYYQWEHYKTVVSIGAARFAKSRTELAAHLNAYLADPALDRAERRRLVEVQVGSPIGSAGKRIAEALRNIAA